MALKFSSIILITLLVCFLLNSVMAQFGYGGYGYRPFAYGYRPFGYGFRRPYGFRPYGIVFSYFFKLINSYLQ